MAACCPFLRSVHNMACRGGGGTKVSKRHGLCSFEVGNGCAISCNSSTEPVPVVQVFNCIHPVCSPAFPQQGASPLVTAGLVIHTYYPVEQSTDNISGVSLISVHAQPPHQGGVTTPYSLFIHPGVSVGKPIILPYHLQCWHS